eukprot:1513171-Prymnesium_polylepis.1
MHFFSDDAADDAAGTDALSLTAPPAPTADPAAGVAAGGADVLRVRRGDAADEWHVVYGHPLSAYQALGATLAFLAKSHARSCGHAATPLLASPRRPLGAPLAAFATPRQDAPPPHGGAARP